jgi:predicted nucleic acid-binding protein
MQAIVLDTDVFSFLAKGDSRGLSYLPHLVGVQQCICFQTVAGLRLWIIVRKWGDARQQALEADIRKFVVLPFDSDMATHWAQITALRRALGQPIDCGDAWIASAARRHDATLLSHNRSHYLGIPDLKLISYG